MTISKYSQDFYRQRTVTAAPRSTNTSAGEIVGSAVSIEGCEGVKFLTQVTGGTGVGTANYIKFKKIEFGNSDFSANVTSFDIDSDYILIDGNKDNIASLLKLTAVGQFEVGIATQMAVAGQTHVRLVNETVGDALNLISQSYAVKTLSNIS